MSRPCNFGFVHTKFSQNRSLQGILRYTVHETRLQWIKVTSSAWSDAPLCFGKSARETVKAFAFTMMNSVAGKTLLIFSYFFLYCLHFGNFLFGGCCATKFLRIIIWPIESWWRTAGSTSAAIAQSGLRCQYRSSPGGSLGSSYQSKHPRKQIPLHSPRSLRQRCQRCKQHVVTQGRPDEWGIVPQGIADHEILKWCDLACHKMGVNLTSTTHLYWYGCTFYISIFKKYTYTHIQINTINYVHTLHLIGAIVAIKVEILCLFALGILPQSGRQTFQCSLRNWGGKSWHEWVGRKTWSRGPAGKLGWSVTKFSRSTKWWY